jgi:hypothetical protein
MTSMRDLTEGTRIRHLTWGDKGTIHVFGGRVFVKLDGMSPAAEIRPGGDIEPEDVEILREGS